MICRGLRELEGIQSLREFSRRSGISTPVISRLERGLLMPSVDLLFRWSTGLNDGTRPSLSDWATAVYAAAATWDAEPAFMLVMYADQVHAPFDCWSLACAAADLLSDMLSSPPPELVPQLDVFLAMGASRYPRFRSIIHDSEGHAALKAAWFELFRQSDRKVYAQVSAVLLDPDHPISSASENRRIVTAARLSEVFVDNGQVPITTDPKPSPILTEVWRRLSPSAREALIEVARQMAPPK